MRSNWDEEQCCILRKAGSSAPKEDNHDGSDDDLDRGRKRHTHCKNPLKKNRINKTDMTQYQGWYRRVGLDEQRVLFQMDTGNKLNQE